MEVIEKEEGEVLKIKSGGELGRIRVLVVRFSSMGDVLLTTPVLRALHGVLEGDVEVHFLTKVAFAPLVQGLPNVHRVHTIERATTEVEAALKAIGFHYVVDLHRSARSAFVKRMLRKDGALSLVVDKRNYAKWKLVRGWSYDLAGEHIVDRYMATLAPFSGGLGSSHWDDGGGLDLPVLPDMVARGLPKNFVALAVGAAHQGKTIPVSHWVEVAQVLRKNNCDVVLLGGPDDLTTGAEIAAACGPRASGMMDLTGRLTLLESFAVLSFARVLAVGDTGLMHAGAAAGVPMVVVWGCTAPALGMGPYRPGGSVIELEPEGRKMIEGVRRPCSKLGNRCRYDQPCIETVSPARIADALEALLSQTAP